MFEILEINETQDDKDLLRAFIKQYSQVWLTTKENEKTLLDRLHKN